MADDGYTTLLRTTDPSQGELVAEMLRREGIEARFHQVRSTLIGMAGNLIEMTVDVPVAAEARARELLADLEYVGAAESADEEISGGRDAEAAGPLRSRRHPLLAVGFALFVPGGGHLYARRPWTALVLALGVVGALAVAMLARERLVFELAFAIWLATVACDGVGGVRAARAASRGEQWPRRTQVAVGVGLLATAIIVGGGLRVATAAPRIARTWRLLKYEVSCNDGAIVIHNRDDRAHAVEISNLRIRASAFFGEGDVYTVGPAGASRLDLTAGGRSALTAQLPAWLAEACGISRATDAAAPPSWHETPRLGSVPLHFHCRLLFDFSPAPPPADEGPFDALGTCEPGYDAAGRLLLRSGAPSDGA